MIAFPEMLIEAAEKAGIKVPESKDLENYDPKKFPHWRVFCTMQLGAAMPYWGCHWDNAKVIAEIPENKIKKVKWADIVGMGFHIST